MGREILVGVIHAVERFLEDAIGLGENGVPSILWRQYEIV